MNGAVIGGLAAAALVPLVMRWLARPSMVPTAPGELVYDKRLRVVSVLFGVIPTTFVAGLGIASRPQTRQDLVGFVFVLLLFPTLAAPLVVEALRVRVTFDDCGIHVSSPWSRERTLSWLWIRIVRWNKAIRWLVISDGGATTVRISPLLSGLAAFAVVCRQHVPPEVLQVDPDGAAAIDLMARGRGSQLAWRTERPSNILHPTR